MFHPIKSGWEQSMVDLARPTVRTNCMEQGVRFALKAPALVIAEMKVQGVVVKDGQGAEGLFDEGGIKVVAR